MWYYTNSLGLPCIRTTGSYPSLLMETRLTRNTFLRYDDACGAAHVLEFMMEGQVAPPAGADPAQHSAIRSILRSNLF